MPKKTYYSYSRLWCWLKDPEGYYTKYVLGIWDPSSPKMLLGTIWSDAYSGIKYIEGWKSPTGKSVQYNWKDALKNPEKYYKDVPEGFRRHKDYLSHWLIAERVMERAFNDPKLVKLPYKLCEQTLKVETDICPLQAKNDGYDPKKLLVIENKFGAAWSEERAFTDDQITFYAYIVWLMTGKIPVVRLQNIISTKGDVLAWDVKKKESDFGPLKEKIDFAYNGIINEVYQRVG